MNLLNFLYLPLITGLICLILPRRMKYGQEIIGTIGSALFFILAVQAYRLPEQTSRIPWFRIGLLDFALDFRLYHFSQFLLLFLALFTLLNVLYSAYYFRDKSISRLYVPFVQFTLAGAVLIVLADNFFVLLLGWELVTLLLFFLIAMGNGKPAAMSAGKAFAILGFTDVALLFAVVAIPLLYDTWRISELRLIVGDAPTTIIFLLLFTAAIAKAGAMPFHSWIPPTAQDAPLPVVALLPAALDKLLGIYLLARLTLDIFVLNQTMLLVMLIIGAVTLIFANFMALIQKDLRKFLGFATVTQVGFMLIGFGSGTVVGILGGLFHMLNHAIYKTLLFFGVGVVEKETGTTDMDKLGGLAKTMPITFGLMTIGVLAASGIPPFNAFVSKWMIYQGTLEAGKPVFLIIAMFGSALTLATFLKMWFAGFLGTKPTRLPKTIGDGSVLSQITMFIPAALCIVFGIFAQYPINEYFAPIVGKNIAGIPHTINIGTAFYNPTLATVLLLLGLFLGGLTFAISRFPVRESKSLFIGGEKFTIGNHRYGASEMYESINRMDLIGTALRESNKGMLDIYNLSSDLGLILVKVLKKLHDGVLSTYLAWCVIGLGILCFIFLVF